MTLLGDQTSATPHPLRELLSLAFPTVAQMASYTLMQFIDTWILAKTGNVIALTAAATSGMLAFSAIALGMGVMFVVNTLVSQSFGRADHKECGRYLWQGIWFALGFSALLWPLTRAASSLFLFLGHEPQLAALETTYMRIVLSAAFLKLAATALEQFLMAINRPAVVAVASATAVLVNALAAWVLVLGRLGFAPHGVAGSAIAQNIGVATELIFVSLFAFAPAIRQSFNLTDWTLRAREMWMLLKMGVPAGVQFVTGVLAWTAFVTWVMAPFHTETIAANVLVFRYMSVSFMPAFGISIAVTALVGRYIGMGRPDIAAQRANLGFLVILTYMIGCGLLLFLFRAQLIGLFTTNPSVLRTGQVLLIFAAVYQLFDGTYIVYNGALRGAGDTFVPALVTASVCWGIIVFGGFLISRLCPHLGPAGPWITDTASGIVLGIFMFTRFTAGNWRRIHLENN
jgi:MATE family multidrug resistance protein